TTSSQSRRDRNDAPRRLRRGRSTKSSGTGGRAIRPLPWCCDLAHPGHRSEPANAPDQNARMTTTQFALNAFYALALAMNMFVIASGLNLIFGVLRVINFAHGMFYTFGAYIVFTVTKSWGMPF